jgi:hypothetical protein
MKGLLADINIQGHVLILLQVWQSAAWREVWDSLALDVYVFNRLGLPRDTSDARVWQECQARQLVLITANRNAEGPDSLESTLRTQNTPASLPVMTVANARRVQLEAAYASRVAVKLLEHFLDIDRFRGTGRLFVP